MRKLIVLISMTALALTSVVTFGSGSAMAQPISGPTCTGSHTGTTWNSVLVPSNSFCSLTDSWVGGSVLVSPGASFETCADHIVGSISANSAYLNIDGNTWVGGSISTINPGANAPGSVHCLKYTPNTPSVYYSSLICPYHVGGSISEQNLGRNRPPVLIGECSPGSGEIWLGIWIGGSVLMAGNRGNVTLQYATVVGNVTCANDNPNSVTSEVYATVIVGCAEESMD